MQRVIGTSQWAAPPCCSPCPTSLLRRSKPNERKEILEALGPVLGAVGSPEPRAPALPADQGPV